MQLKPCLECGQNISPVVTSCPNCGAHYTAALGTFHRGLTYSGLVVAFHWLLLFPCKGMHRQRWFSSSDVTQAIGDIQVSLFFIAVFLISWGSLYGRMRRDRVVVTFQE